MTFLATLAGFIVGLAIGAFLVTVLYLTKALDWFKRMWSP